MKTVAIIQARMSSSRLPGKVLRLVGSQPMLARVLARASRANLVDEVLVATTNDPSDEPIAIFCHSGGIPCFRGDLYDVLDRYYQAAKQAGADVIVRITADCPFIDPREIDRTIRHFFDASADFSANRLPPPFKRTTPIGMDTEVCSFAALERAWQEAAEPFEREHVMPYLYDSPGRFKVSLADLEDDLSHLRFTVDTPEDLEVANQIYAAFDNRDDFSLQDLLTASAEHPEWQAQVAGVKHKNLFAVDQRADAREQKNETAQKEPPNKAARPAAALRCPLCGKSDARVLSEMNSFGFKVRYYLCQTCGFVYQNPGESAAADPAFYEETYRRLYQETEEPTAKDLRQQHLRAESEVGFLREQGICCLRRGLDIGASSGILLQTIHEAFGAEMVGVEPGNAYRKLAEAKGFRLYPSLEDLRKEETEKFDLVTMMHVLEHLENPLGTLREIREHLLEDSGFLLVEVPNFYAHNSYELAHLSCFTEHTLIEMLKRAGYEAVSRRKHGFPRSETLDLYLTVLAAPRAKTGGESKIVPEHGVAFKRALGMFKRGLLTKLLPDKTWLPMEDEA